VHLARDPLGFGVDALGGAVAVRKCECGDHSVPVSVQAPERRNADEVDRSRGLGRSSVRARRRFLPRGVRSWAKSAMWVTSWVIWGQAAVSRARRS
jgi:hypothetical protein